MDTAKHKSPVALGYSMPAEWTTHEATWITWPHNANDWPGKIAPIHWVYAEIVRKISPGEIVRIIVNSPRSEAIARRALTRAEVDLAKVEFLPFPTDRGWCRDFGPIFVKNKKNVAIARFAFNAWAKYPDWTKDNQIPEAVAKRFDIQMFSAIVDGRNFVLEGGAIDVNGAGTLLTTEECLLDQQTQCRNPGMGAKEIEKTLHQYLGAKNVIWLNKGIAGDDTHGHVDDLARFVNVNTIALCREGNPSEINYKPLEENVERLTGARLADGSKPDVVYLPMPEPLSFEGMRLPASYANFYISNHAVIVPTFNDPNDRKALGILAELFPDRRVVGIHAVDLVWGLGTLHCLTQQQPAM